MTDIDEIERSARALLAADPDDYETASREYREVASAANVLVLTAKAREAETLREDAERYRWLQAWYLRDGTRAEINPNGHIERTTPEIMDAAIDAARQKVTA